MTIDMLVSFHLHFHHYCHMVIVPNDLYVYKRPIYYFYIFVCSGGGCKHNMWTTPDPCLVLSESDSKLYNNFEFFDEKYYKYLSNIFIYKAKHLMMTKKIPRKVYII